MTYLHCFAINTFEYGRVSELRENIKRFDSFSNFTFRTILRFRNMSFPHRLIYVHPKGFFYAMKNKTLLAATYWYVSNSCSLHNL